MSNSKKDSLNRKINIKNKKEATKLLTKKNTVTKVKKKEIKKSPKPMLKLKQ